MLGFPRRSFDNIFRGTIIDEMFSSLSGQTGERDFEIDAKNEGGDIIIRADLPGIRKEDVKVTLENGILTISAERKSETEKDGDNVYFQERTFGSFRRSLALPPDVSEDVNAILRDGVLQLILKRTEEAKPRKIEIS